MYTKVYTKDGREHKDFYQSWYDVLFENFGGSVGYLINGIIVLIIAPFLGFYSLFKSTDWYFFESLLFGFACLFAGVVGLIISPFVVIHSLFRPRCMGGSCRKIEMIYDQKATEPWYVHNTSGLKSRTNVNKKPPTTGLASGLTENAIKAFELSIKQHEIQKDAN